MGFNYNNVHSDAFAIAVRTTKMPYIPEKRQTVVNVLGKDGGYVFEDQYKNIFIDVSCSITMPTLYERRKIARDISGWLSAATPAPLRFDYEPDIEYEVVKVINNVNGIFRGYQVPIDDFDITFECRPYQQQSFYNDDIPWEEAYVGWTYAYFPWEGYLRIFESEDSIGVGGILYNIGTYPAKPIIKISATGASAEVAIGTALGKSFVVSNITSPVYVDCQDEVVYTLTGDMKVNKILDFVGDFITIAPSSTGMAINIEGTFDTVEVEFDYRNMYT